MEEEQNIEKKSTPKIIKIYDQQYKKLLVIPFILLFAALSILGARYLSEGSFIDKDVSLKGGITLTIPTSNEVNILELKEKIAGEFKGYDIDIRLLRSAGKNVGIIISADIDGSNQEMIDTLLVSIEENTGFVLNEEDYSLEFVGSSLGASFFREVIRTIAIAFIFMSIVVFVYFRNFIPSTLVVLCGFSDIITTLAIVSLLDIKLSTSGIAAFLMLIGYSVDTDILLTNKVLKTKEGTVLDRIFIAIKTGLMMSATTIGVVLIAFIFTKSDVIRQIMIILLIGLILDLIFTWIQNVGLLRIYLERKLKVKNE